MNEHNDSCTSSLNRVLSAIKEKGINDFDNQNIEADLECINHLLNTNNIQSILITCILESSFTRTGTTVKQICTLLNCSNIEFLKYSNELDDLVKRGMVKYNVIISAFSESNGYVVAPAVIEAIKRDVPFIEEPTKNLTPEQFFGRVGRLFVDSGNDRLRSEELNDSLTVLVKNNGQLAFCKSLAEYDFAKCEIVESLLFMTLCSNYVNQGSDSIPKDNILAFVGTMGILRTTYTAIRNGHLMIQQKELVEYGNDNGMADTDAFFLSDMAKETFFTDFEIELDVRRTCPDIINADSIMYSGRYPFSVPVIPVHFLGVKTDYLLRS